VALLGFLSDSEKIPKYGSVDLRARVVGARLLMEGRDPYFFKWKSGYPDSLLDPSDRPHYLVSRVSVTPAVLTLHTTMASLPYITQKFIWFVLQWVLLLLSIAIFAVSADSTEKASLTWIMGLILVSGSYFWRMHVGNGQIYILYMFLFAVSYWVLQKSFKHNAFIGGFLLGFNASLMPLLLVVNIPIVFYKKWKLFFGNMVGFLYGIIPSLFMGGVYIWRNFLTRATLNRNLLFVSQRNNIVYPRIVEGMEGFSEFYPPPDVDTSIWRFIDRYFGVQISLRAILISLFLVLLFICYLLYKYRLKKIKNSLLFLIGAEMFFLSSLFVINPRFSYNNTIWLVIFSLIIGSSDSRSSYIIPLRMWLAILFFTLFFVVFNNLRGMLLLFNYVVLFYTLLAMRFFLKRDWQSENDLAANS
jgi:hypothetical protein